MGWIVTVAAGVVAAVWPSGGWRRAVGLLVAVVLVAPAAAVGSSARPVDEALLEVGRLAAGGGDAEAAASVLIAPLVGRGYVAVGDGWVSAVPVDDVWMLAGVVPVRQAGRCRQVRWDDAGAVELTGCRAGTAP